MHVQVIDVLRDQNWSPLLASHSRASFFHSSAWARVLHDTYGHQPVYFCQIEDEQLKGLLPVMEVNSALTHRRGIALPFTDFSAPFATSQSRYQELFDSAVKYGRNHGWAHLECRGGYAPAPEARPSTSFHGHDLDLTAGEQPLFNGLDSAMRRGIRKAQNAGLTVQFSTNDQAMREFYLLHSGTRRRHGLPPQPYRFFENITRHVLARGLGFIASIAIASEPVAAAIFFHNNCQAIYKFGASDFAFQQLRPNNLLMWEAIKHCAGLGIQTLHFGRTSFANEGLRRFKQEFGAREERIDYFKFDLATRSFVTDADRVESWHNFVFRCLPGPLLRLAGRTLYPHLA